MVSHGVYSALAIVMAVLSGAVITPLLLPWLPGRAFSLKGMIPGMTAWVVLLALRGTGWNAWPGRMEAVAWLLLIPAVSAYLAMNFTGASTYTSLSGVRKEMRWAVPLQIGAGIAGLGFWIGSHLAA
jgi:acetyl-CoA decarbonylase/synthase complex subunit gamma